MLNGLFTSQGKHTGKLFVMSIQIFTGKDPIMNTQGTSNSVLQKVNYLNTCGRSVRSKVSMGKIPEAVQSIISASPHN